MAKHPDRFFGNHPAQAAAARARAGLPAGVPIIGQTQVPDCFGREVQVGDIVDLRDFRPETIGPLFFRVLSITPGTDPRMPPGALVLQLHTEFSLPIVVQPGKPVSNLLLAHRPPQEASVPRGEPLPVAEPVVGEDPALGEVPGVEPSKE